MSNHRYLALPALAGALLGASVAAFAQSAPPPAAPNASYPSAPPYAQPHASAQPGAKHRRHRGPVARALGGLTLSADQRTKIHGFMHAYRASRANVTPETRAQLVAQIEGVLTPDERSRFESQLHRARRHPAGSGSAPISTPTAAP